MQRFIKSFQPVICMSLLVLGTRSAAPAAPITVPLSPVVDSFVTSTYPDNSFGSGGAMCVAASGQTTGEFQDLFRFTTASAVTAFNATFGTGQWTVQSVRLQLFPDTPGSTIFNSPHAGQFSATWMQNDSWPEGSGTADSPGSGGVTFNGLSTYLSSSDEPVGTFSYDGSIGAAKTYSLTLAPGLLADVSAGSDISLRLSPADAQVSYFFHSKDHKTASARPVLYITAVPEPATVCLLVIGAAAVGLRRVVRGSRRSRND